jgi:hypothetical protein
MSRADLRRVSLRKFAEPSSPCRHGADTKEPRKSLSLGVYFGAGDRDRTDDIQLGKLTLQVSGGCAALPEVSQTQIIRAPGTHARVGVAQSVRG